MRHDARVQYENVVADLNRIRSISQIVCSPSPESFDEFSTPNYNDTNIKQKFDNEVARVNRVIKEVLDSASSEWGFRSA